MGGQKDFVKYLVNSVKVDIFKKDNQSKIGSDHALENGHDSIVSWLSQFEDQ